MFYVEHKRRCVVENDTTSVGGKVEFAEANMTNNLI